MPPVSNIHDDESTTVVQSVPPEFYISDGAIDNYKGIARAIMATNGVSARSALDSLADEWDRQHVQRPNDGFDHLSAWARSIDDVSDASVINPAVAAASRAVESAKRDPNVALAGSSDAVNAALATYASTPTDDYATRALNAAAGTVPNTGPVAPDESAVGSSSEPVEPEQGATIDAPRPEDSPTSSEGASTVEQSGGATVETLAAQANPSGAPVATPGVDDTPAG